MEIYYVKIKENVPQNKWYGDKQGGLFEVYEFMDDIFTIDEHMKIDLSDCELVDNTYLYNEIMNNRKEINILKTLVEKLSK